VLRSVSDALDEPFIYLDIQCRAIRLLPCDRGFIRNHAKRREACPLDRGSDGLVRKIIDCGFIRSGSVGVKHAFPILSSGLHAHPINTIWPEGLGNLREAPSPTSRTTTNFDS